MIFFFNFLLSLVAPLPRSHGPQFGNHWCRVHGEGRRQARAPIQCAYGCLTSQSRRHDSLGMVWVELGVNMGNGCCCCWLAHSSVALIYFLCIHFRLYCAFTTSYLTLWNSNFLLILFWFQQYCFDKTSILILVLCVVFCLFWFYMK